METPLISIVMAVYNEKETELRQSIESILKQSYQNFEFIIVLDNPDNQVLAAVLNEYAKEEPRIVLINNEHNLGLAPSLNRGLKASRGDYIARMDADDIAVPERLTTEFNLLQQRQLDVIAASSILIDDANTEIGRHPQMVESAAAVRELLQYDNFIVHPSVLGKKAAFEIVGGYQEQLIACEDYDLWLRMIAAGQQIGVTNEPLMRYRIRQNSMTQSDMLKTFLISGFLRQTTVFRLTASDEAIKAKLEAYLTEKGFYDQHKKDRFNANINLLSTVKKTKSIGKGLQFLGILLSDGNVRQYYLEKIQYSRILKRLSK